MNGGAVAYLSHSQYGRNGKEVIINNNSNYITGIAGDTVSASESTSTENTYNTTEGMLASTTGNIYGVYDVNGPAGKYTAGWDTLSSSSYITNYGKAIDGTVYFSENGESDRTKTAYRNGTNEYYGEKIREVCRTGDGIKEMWINTMFGWFNDGLACVSSGSPFSVRGGVCSVEEVSGVFFAHGHNGTPGGGVSFRAVLAR